MVLTAARRARPGVRIAVAGSLVLLVLVAAYLAATLRYDLTYGSFGGNPGAYATVTAGDVTEYRYLARPGRTIEYGFSIANHGPLPVRLEQVISNNRPYTVEPVRVDEDFEDGFDPSEAVPFRPTDLRRNDEVVVWMTMQLPEAAPTPPCGAFGFDTQTVRFRVLGVPREQDVPIGYFIKVVTPGADGQPCGD